jgi:hypothetical protein
LGNIGLRASARAGIQCRFIATLTSKEDDVEAISFERLSASQLADISTKGLHYPQRQAYVEGILGKTFEPSYGTSNLKRGWIAESSGDRQGSQVESRRPLRGVL